MGAVNARDRREWAAGPVATNSIRPHCGNTFKTGHKLANKVFKDPQSLWACGLAGLMARYLVDKALSWVNCTYNGTLRFIRAMVPCCCRFLGRASYPCERRELYRLISSGKCTYPSRTTFCVSPASSFVEA